MGRKPAASALSACGPLLPPPSHEQLRYAARRRAWHAQFINWMAERDLPGWPLNPDHAQALSDREGPR